MSNVLRVCVCMHDVGANAKTKKKVKRTTSAATVAQSASSAALLELQEGSDDEDDDDTAAYTQATAAQAIDDLKRDLRDTVRELGSTIDRADSTKTQLEGAKAKGDAAVRELSTCVTRDPELHPRALTQSREPRPLVLWFFGSLFWFFVLVL
jgi:hypothetical protein